MLATFTFVFLPSFAVVAQGLSCKNLFDRTYKATEFVIQIAGKKESTIYLAAAHENLTSTFQTSNLNAVLKRIKKEGIEKLSPEERKFIFKFRQNSSFLRSIFQSAEHSHQSPREFAEFVRDFGKLKDYILMDDGDGAKSKASSILKKYKSLDFEALLQDSKPASKKSVKKYFKLILNDTKQIMARQKVTVDEVHDVRKNLRDVLRYMQISDEVAYAKASGGKNLNLGHTPELQDTVQIEFLKKINEKLGEICDENSASILRGELTEETIIDFPEKIRPRITYFLENFKIQIAE